MPQNNKTVVAWDTILPSELNNMLSAHIKK